MPERYRFSQNKRIPPDRPGTRADVICLLFPALFVRAFRLALVGCFLVALFSVPLPAQAAPDTPNITGTGFFVTDNGVAVTNFHVVQE
jgi:S1-C subfamily serine protease